VLIRSLIVLTLVATSIEARAQSGARLDPGLLRLTTDSLEVYLVRQGEQHRTGTIVDALDTVRVNGELRFRRIYTRTDALLGNGVDTLSDAFADITLRLVDSRSDDGGVEHVEWRNGRLTGFVEQRGQPARQVDLPSPKGTFSSASFDLMLRAAPLADRFTTMIPAFSGRQGPKNLSAKVAGSETLPRFGPTWRIEADFGGRSATFWITKDSRRMVRQLIRAAPGVDILIIAAR